jgi:thioredoxin reductase (NADPH)
MADYDIVIIGAGPAGLTAGLYAARAGMQVLVLEKGLPGGQMLLTEEIENFPGFAQGMKGQQLAQRFKEQALKAGVEIISDGAEQIIQPSQAAGCYSVKTKVKDYFTHSVILACGAVPKRLGVPAEEALTGRGVSYCATCDGPLFRGREVVVVGGGNAACEEALYLAKFVRKVSLVHRRVRLRADQVLQERLKGEPKIDFILNSQVLEILGEQKVSAVKLKDLETGKERNLSCAAVFIFAGFKPNTDFLQGLVKKDNSGFILTDEHLASSCRGIFACGDCRLRPLRQIVTACGEGAEAAMAARDYVERLKGTAYPDFAEEYKASRG